MREALKKLVDDTNIFYRGRAAAEKQLYEEIEEAKQKYNGDYLKQKTSEMQEQHHAKYRGEFAEIAKRLNAELDKMQADVEKEIANSKPENYDLKLANVLQMLNVLDKNGITHNMASVQEAVKGFAYDPLARAAISSVFTAKGVIFAFDDSKSAMLEHIETARKFADGYSTEMIGLNMEWFFNNHFDDSPAEDGGDWGNFLIPRKADTSQIRED